MHKAESLRLNICAFVIFVLVLSALGLRTFAQQQATPDQLAILKLFGINSTIVDPTFLTQINGGCNTNPYQILESQFKGRPGTGITPHANGTSVDLTDGLNPTLACRMLQFFQYAQQTKGCVFKITYGFRSHAEQASLCGAGGSGTGCIAPGASCHQYGLAADIVSSASCISWARSYLGTKNPNSAGAQQFKIHFPYDGDHLQCIENMVANCKPQSSCGPLNINPNLAGNWQQAAANAGSFTSPTAALAQALRNYLNPPPPVSPTVPSTSSSGCISYYPVSTPSSDPCAYYVPSASSSVSNTINTSSAAATSSTASSLLNALANPTPTSSVPTSNTINSSIPAITLITSIAYPSSTVATSTATGTPVALISGITSGVSLNSTNQATSTHSATSTYQISPTAPQTFTSQDLSQTVPAQSNGPVRNTTFAMQILNILKQALLKVIALLQPFGGKVATPKNSATAFIE